MVVYNFVEQCFRPEMIKAGMLQARRIVDKNKVQTPLDTYHQSVEMRHDSVIANIEGKIENNIQD